MDILRNVSIKHKLTRVVMLTMAVVLLLACLAFGVYDQISYRKIVKNELQFMTEAIGSSSVAALEFDNPKLGKEVLRDLKTVRRVVAARVFDKSGKVFVAYGQGGETSFNDPDSPRLDGIYFENNHILIFQPVTFEKNRIGTIYVRARAEDIYYRLKQYMIIASFVFGLSCVLAYLMSSRLQTSISGPILRLAKTADRVSSQNNYSIRAVKDSDDEVGFLIDRFNEMLTRIDLGDKALRETTVSRDYVDNILQNMRDSLIVVSPDGTIKTINQATVDITGYKEEELLGKPVGSLFKVNGANDVSLDSSELLRLLATGGMRNVEKPLLSKDGRALTLLISGSVMRDSGGVARGIILAATDITERKRAEQELVKAHKEAERANQAKSEFLARMSHELRTPMNSILGYSELILSNQDEPLTTEQNAGIGHILNSGKRLLELINEVLDLAQIDSGRIPVKLEPVSVNSLMENIFVLIRPMTLKNQIQLSAPASMGHGFFVLADKSLLRQVLLNLLSNAVKYNRKNGFVNIACQEERSGWLRIIIHDTGMGIPDEMSDLLFEPFERLGKENSDIGGAGVGLAIAKRLVELMNGTIGYKSSIGEGSSFYIELPVCDFSGEAVA